MPSFDVVSNVDAHELTNAVDQANRELQSRFDFKNTNARYELDKQSVTCVAENEFQIKQMQDILNSKMIKRNIDIKSLEYGNIQMRVHEARLVATIKQGISTENAKKITKAIKESGLKVQTAIQDEQIRVTAKKRDDLQAVIALLKKGNFELPLQYVNFRD